MTIDTKTGLSLGDARSKLAGLHFAQESLTCGERNILRIAEAVLRMHDAEIERLRRLVGEACDAADICIEVPFSSRSCEHGTKCCVRDHTVIAAIRRESGNDGDSK